MSKPSSPIFQVIAPAESAIVAARKSTSASPRSSAVTSAAEQARNTDEGLLRGRHADDYDVMAVHAGGRTILDAVESGLELGPAALGWSRGVLRDFGNMSSATLMFILRRILDGFRPAAGRSGDGFAVAFGPGLAAESFRFQVLT